MNEEQIKELVKNTGSELIETHISWLLLTDEHAYKIKKPVKFSFLDFTTLEKRKFFCEEEVRLNRRLAPDVYLGVVSITKDGLEKEGEEIGYAVKMKKLDKDKTMDKMLKQGKVTEEQIKEIAERIAEFHQKIDVIKGNYSTSEIVWKQIEDLGSFREIIEKSCGIGGKVDYILENSKKFIENNETLFKKRIEDGMVRDCHGDLHSANIFLNDEIVIFDCIEFNKDFRYVDVASEIAFMSMDLDAFGREDLAELFVETYLAKTKDEELRKILPLYKCYRANVRAKIAAIDYSQHPGDEPKERIKKYTELAEKYAKNLK